MANPRHPLELNVGFLINAVVGTSREFSFDYEELNLGEDIKVTNFTGNAVFSRTQQGLILQGTFSTTIELECVRCLDLYRQALSCSFTELYAFDNRSITESNLLVPDDGRIDLAPIIREYAILEIPIQPICTTDCKGLCPICGENLNQIDCGHHPTADESPFTQIKDLMK